MHSWTMRYRADRHEGAPIWYFPQDPYASTDPTDPKFGGIAFIIS